MDARRRTNPPAGPRAGRRHMRGRRKQTDRVAWLCRISNLALPRHVVTAEATSEVLELDNPALFDAQQPDCMDSIE